MTRACLLLAALIAAMGAADASAQPAAKLEGDGERGATLFRQRCVVCHAKTDTAQGPHLNGIINRRPAATKFEFSFGMKVSSWIWSVEKIDRYLENPTAEISGTKMTVRVPNPQDRADLIAHLRTLR